ncbi:MAG: exo-alpha-sialidase [Alphaproteobacteria bacterium]|nr:exo-alpha-sialidase [Alphaproteobacteria bacterium]
MLKHLLVSACLAMPAAAEAYSACTLAPLTGAGGSIAQEGANPVTAAGWIYAGAIDKKTVRVWTSSDGGNTLGAPASIFTGLGNVKDLRLAAEGSNLYAVWLAKSDGEDHLWFAVGRKHAARWTKPRDLGVVDASLPQIAADGRNVHIAYLADTTVMVINSADAGKTLSAPVAVAPGWGEIVTTAAGRNVYVAWNTQPAPKRYEVWTAASTDGGKHFAARNMSASRQNSAEEPIFTIDRASGRVSLVWRDAISTDGNYLQTTDHGATWTAPLLVDTPARQFMVVDDGKTIYVSYLKEMKVDGATDWQLHLATSTDGGKSFPSRVDLTGPTGIGVIQGDDYRPIPWIGRDGQFRLTGVKADGIYAWNGHDGHVLAPVHLGEGRLAAPAFNSFVWQSSQGAVSYAVCK